MTDVLAWVILKRDDLVDLSKEEAPLSSPISIHLKKDLTFQELQVEVRKWLGLQPDSTEVIKLRLKDKTLVPLSSLLAGNSKNEPFLMEVAKVHQHALSSGTPLPKIYKEAIENRIQDLQKRIQQMEAMLPDLRSRREASIKQVAEELDYKVQFLDRRIDELAPQEWKDRLRKPALIS